MPKGFADHKAPKFTVAGLVKYHQHEEARDAMRDQVDVALLDTRHRDPVSTIRKRRAETVVAREARSRPFRTLVGQLSA